jgi:hypothetical protein
LLLSARGEARGGRRTALGMGCRTEPRSPGPYRQIFCFFAAADSLSPISYLKKKSKGG